MLSATAMGAALPKPRAKATRFAHRLEAWGAASAVRRVQAVAPRLRFRPRRCIGAPHRPVSRRPQTCSAQRQPRLSRPRSPASAPGCGTISAVSRPNIRILTKIRVFEPGGRVETHGFEHVDRAVAAGRRMIVFPGHIATWEIAMLAGIQHGISASQIYRAGDNPLLDRLITRFRGYEGELAPKGRSRRGTHLTRRWKEFPCRSSAVQG
jgi:Bacterial lipid A biosynthesis acyltransferase